MELWLLRPVTGGAEEGPWNPWFDKAFGFVICAETEARARMIASENGGKENPTYNKPDGSPWLDPTLSTCIPLRAGDTEAVVIQDFAAA